MLFKRKKKHQAGITTEEVENTLPENDTPEDLTAEVIISEVAQEIGEEVTVYSKVEKTDPTEQTLSSPTVKIPNIKGFTEELLCNEATESTEESETVSGASHEEDSVEENLDMSETESAESTTEETEEKTATDEEAETASEVEQTQDAGPVQENVQKNSTTKKKIKKKKTAFARRKERVKILKGIANTILWATSLLLFVFCLSNLYQQVFNKDVGLGFFKMGNAVVVSESMSPNLEINDFIVYRQTAIEELKVGDVVVYKRPIEEGQMLIVHRLQSITDGYAVTKGDNNQISDEPFEASNIVGRVMFTVPKLGVLLDAISSIWGVLAMGVLFCVMTITQFAYRKLSYQAWLKKLAVDKEERKAVQAFLDL